MVNQGCIIATDARLLRRDAQSWDPAQGFSPSHWQACFRAFGEVAILARVADVSEDPPELGCVPEQVAVIDLPYFIGPWAALKNTAGILGRCKKTAEADARFVLRAPGFVASMLMLWLRFYQKPYIVEVLGDPDEVWRVLRHPLRIVWRVLSIASLRTAIRGSHGVLYVSETLARKYPAPARVSTAVASDVRLEPDTYRMARRFTEGPVPLRLIHIGSMAREYKGHRVLLRAMAICLRSGLRVELSLVGDGVLRGEFEAEARRLGITSTLKFHGTVPWGEPLFRLLDAADLFVLPSQTEGLPRALLEAMARGLPAIASGVGGIPELLSREAMFPPDNEHALADKIRAIGQSRDRLNRLSEQGRATAGRFRAEVLDETRHRFYGSVGNLI